VVGTNQKDESVRLQVTLTKSQWEKFLKMRELLSNTLPGGSNWHQVLECVADKVIKLKDKSQGNKYQTISRNLTMAGKHNKASLRCLHRMPSLDAAHAGLVLLVN
jgi:hypothetical protein